MNEREKNMKYEENLKQQNNQKIKFKTEELMLKKTRKFSTKIQKKRSSEVKKNIYANRHRFLKTKPK